MTHNQVVGVTPQSVQAELDSAVSYLSKTTSSYQGMVKKYGSDWTAWPKTSNWYLALSAVASARSDVGQLTVKVLTAAFTEEQV